MSRIEWHQSARCRPEHRVLSVAFAAILLTASSSLAEEKVQTNLELMTDLTTQVVSELVDRFSSELSGWGVLLQPFANNEQYQFMTNVFTAALTQRGVTTFQPGADPLAGEDAGYLYVLKYQATSFSLSYPKVYRSYLIGGKRVRRRADVTLLATLVDHNNGAVAALSESGRDHEDQFDFSDVDRVEEGTYEFTRPPMPSSGWGKYAEPVLVTGIIVGLIYLFFSNQSDN